MSFPTCNIVAPTHIATRDYSLSYHYLPQSLANFSHNRPATSSKQLKHNVTSWMIENSSDSLPRQTRSTSSKDSALSNRPRTPMSAHTPNQPHRTPPHRSLHQLLPSLPRQSLQFLPLTFTLATAPTFQALSLSTLRIFHYLSVSLFFSFLLVSMNTLTSN